MTAHLTAVLSKLRLKFYEDRWLEFEKDKTALIKAMARYGFECNRRHWQFSVEDIFQAISGVIARITRKDIDYLPAYLESAIDGYVRSKAEELSDQAKTTNHNCHYVLGGLKPVMVIEKSGTEQMDKLYKTLSKKLNKGKATHKQKELL